MSESRGLGREAAIYTLGTVLTAVLGFAAVYVFSRLLAPDEYGEYFVVLSVVELSSLLGGAWINQTMKRHYPGLAPNEIARFMGRVAGAYILTGILMLIVAALASLSGRFTHLPLGLPWLVLLATGPYIGLNFVQWLFRINRQPGGWMLTQLTMMGGRLLLGWLALLYIERSGAVLLLAFAAASFIASIWGLIRLKLPCCITRDCLGWKSVRELMDYGLPLTLVNGGMWLTNSAGRLILNWLVGEAAVGIYATAQQLALQLVQLPVNPVLTAADPLTIHVYEREGKASAARYLRDLLGIVLLLSVGVALAFYLLRFPCVDALLDPKYAAGAGLMGYLAPAVLGWLILPVLTKSHELANKTQELSWLMLGAGVLNIALNFALIPKFEVVGVAVAFTITYVVLCIACYLTGLRRLPWGLPTKIIAPIAFAAAVLIGFDRIYPQPHGLILTALAGIIYVFVYLGAAAGVMYVLRRWLQAEVAFMKHIFELKRSLKATCSTTSCSTEVIEDTEIQL